MLLELVSFLGPFNLWKYRHINKRMNSIWIEFRDSRTFRVPEYGSLEDAMKFAMRMQLTRRTGTRTRMYTRQNPFVIQITGDQTLKYTTLRIYGDYVYIIGIKHKKPIITGTFSFVGLHPNHNHITIKNINMKGGNGCNFENATVTMVDVNVTNTKNSGVRVDGDIALKRCKFSGNRWGLHVQGSVLASTCQFEKKVKLKSVKNSKFNICTFKNGLLVQGNVYLSKCIIDNLCADARELQTTIFQYKSFIKLKTLKNNATLHDGTVQKYTKKKSQNVNRDLDPYIILNVNRNADATTIREAYLRKVKETHPDKLGMNVEFRKTQWAYEILRNNDKKIRYDDGIVLDVDKFVQLRF